MEKQSREELLQKDLTEDRKCCIILLRFTLPSKTDYCDIDILAMIESLPVLSFENTTDPLLLSFIKSQTFTKSTANKGQVVMLKKEKASEVLIVQENLIGMAFFLRSTKLTLTVQRTEIVEAPHGLHSSDHHSDIS